MKFYKICIIFLFLLMFSIGTVCAEDVNQTSQDTLEITDEDVISAGEGTYTDLLNELNSAQSGKVDLSKDYKYNSGKDKIAYISIEDLSTKFVIDGKNHVIDGNGQTYIFKFVRSSDLTLKNLIIRNCNGSAIITDDVRLTLDNVVFEDNYDTSSGGAIYAEQSTIISNKNTFKNNYAEKGASLYLYKSVFKSDGDLFVSNKPVYWSMIYGHTSQLSITNGVFANATSRYATAIYNNYETTIKKSKFINLGANATAGAIAVKGGNDINAITSTVIQDCEFTKVYSSKNGGALYFDIAGNSNYTGGVLVNHTTFKDCLSDFGGAILQLGGNLNVINSNFVNNYAFVSGGAIYTSNSSTYVGGSNFTSNKALYSDGGAIFADFGSAEIELNTFKNNNATEGGAIFMYDTLYSVVQCTFSNNGEAIHSYFDNRGSYQKNNKFGKDKYVLVAEEYRSYVYETGNKIVLNPLKIVGSPSDAYFNLAKQGLVTPVRNQGSLGSCWAFGAAGALESSFLIATNITLDISENNIQANGLRYSPYGNIECVEGASYTDAAAYFLGWLGVVSSESDSYDELGKVSPIIFEENAYHILDVIFINVEDKAAIKDALTKYGALNLYMYGSAANDNKYYNKDTHSVYYNGNDTGNHYVTLVGWDDNYSANNFVSKPKGDGAWICKNSWGTGWGENGYFYLSYYDTSLKNSDVTGYLIKNTEVYNKLFQIDLCGYIGEFIKSKSAKTVKYMNKFSSEDSDLISAVGTYFEKANSDYKITIYVNGGAVYTQSGKSEFAGFNTIKLNQYVAIEENDNFSVSIESVSAPISTYSRLPFEPGVSLIDTGLGFDDVTSKRYVACMKVYTKENTIFSENIKQYYGQSNKFEAYSDFEGAKLILKQLDKELASATVKDGIASFNVVLKPGTYSLLTPYNNTYIINEVEILNTVQVSDSISAGYNAVVTISPSFVDDWGTLLKSIKVKYKIDNAKEVTVVTNNAGKISVKIPKGTSIGNHKVVFTNPVTGEVFTSNVKILSRFYGNANVDMFYSDGSQYKVRIRGDDGNFVGANKVVTIKVGKNSFKVKTNANGYAVWTIPNTFTPAKYTLSVTYAGQTVKNTLNVKQPLTSSKTVTVKKSAKSLVLKATLKGKTAFKNKVVTFKVNGKNYTDKTDSKGVAKVTIPKSAINSLKAGKSYTVQITYLKDTIKSTLKVTG